MADLVDAFIDFLLVIFEVLVHAAIIEILLLFTDAADRLQLLRLADLAKDLSFFASHLQHLPLVDLSFGGEVGLLRWLMEVAVCLAHGFVVELVECVIFLLKGGLDHLFYLPVVALKSVVPILLPFFVL